MKLVAFLCTFLFVSSGLANEPYNQLHTLPVPEKCTVEGEEKLCLDFDAWKKVVLLANDYRGLFMWRLEVSGALDAHEDVMTGYELKIDALEGSINILNEERNYKSKRIDELESAFQKGNNQHKLEKCLMWGVILIETIAIGALGISSFVQAH